jgi:uncharacterized protein (TIGR03790 family)
MHAPRLLAALCLLAAAVPASALGPDDVYLVVNKNVAASRALAEHYCAKRKVPLDHILTLDLPTGEDISRADYDQKLARPLRKLLEENKDRAKVLLTIYGVPLRVGPVELTESQKKDLAALREQLAPLEKKLKEMRDELTALEKKAKDDPKSVDAKDLEARKKEVAAQQERMKPLERERNWLADGESRAAVDSELALLWWGPYELRRWQGNPLYFQVPDEVRRSKPPLVMTCRLDGPDVDLIKKIIDQSVEVEAKGLDGKVYVDARGIRYDSKNDTGHGYGGYDESLREMAKLLQDEAKLPVVLDDKPELFAEGSCPDCALYCGWYSLARYIDCCRFVPGAVAYHIASSEAVSLRDPKSTLWCKNLLEKGVVATLGPVAEPYTVGFPKPAEFFGLLATGDYPLVECYWRTQLFASWMTVLVGDPLYNPYVKTPKLKADRVKPSPAGGKFLTPLERPHFVCKLAKGDDKVEIVEGKDGPVFRVASASGIGKAEVNAADKWPVRVAFQFLKLGGLEGFHVAGGGLTLEGFLKRGEKKTVFLYDKDGKKTTDADRAVVTLTVEAQADRIEVVVQATGALADARTWKVDWVDAYR